MEDSKLFFSIPRKQSTRLFSSLKWYLKKWKHNYIRWHKNKYGLLEINLIFSKKILHFSPFGGDVCGFGWKWQPEKKCWLIAAIWSSWTVTYRKKMERPFFFNAEKLFTSTLLELIMIVSKIRSQLDLMSGKKYDRLDINLARFLKTRLYIQFAV